MKTKKNTLNFAVIIFAIFIFSCNKSKLSNNTCNVSDPIEELNWLKKEIAELKQSNSEYSKASYYNIATYKRKTVFYYGSCHPSADYAFILRNCNGDEVSSVNAVMKDLKYVEVLWKHPDNQCAF